MQKTIKPILILLIILVGIGMTSVSAVPFYSGSTDFSSSTSIKFSSLSEVIRVFATSNTSIYPLSSDLVLIRQSPDLTAIDAPSITDSVDVLLVHSVETSLTVNCLPTWFSVAFVWQDAGLIPTDDIETAITWLGC